MIRAATTSRTTTTEVRVAILDLNVDIAKNLALLLVRRVPELPSAFTRTLTIPLRRLCPQAHNRNPQLPFVVASALSANPDNVAYSPIAMPTRGDERWVSLEMPVGNAEKEPAIFIIAYLCERVEDVAAVAPFHVVAVVINTVDGLARAPSAGTSKIVDAVSPRLGTRQPPDAGWVVLLY